MPMLSNHRHEAFAQSVARGQTCALSYVEAGYKDNYKNANRLKLREDITGRVTELKQLVQKMQRDVSHGVILSKAWVIEQLINVVFLAQSQEKPDLAGANKALHLLGLQLGMFVERKETGKPGEFDGMTIASKRERVLAIADQLGLGNRGRAVGSFML